MTTNPKLQRFLDLFLKSPFYRPVQVVLNEPEAYFAQRMPCPDLGLPPREMIRGPVDTDGNARWNPIDSPITEPMIAGIERFLGITLPPLFKEYLGFQCILCMDLYEGALPATDPRRPLEWLEWCALRREHPAYRDHPFLLPLTYGPDRQFDLCFDSRRPDSTGDYPVIKLDHFHWDVPKCIALEDIPGLQVFDSFDQYFDFLIDWLEYKSSAQDSMFLDWLDKHGKRRPPDFYYESGAGYNSDPGSLSIESTR
jgi:hypothetical protein